MGTDSQMTNSVGGRDFGDGMARRSKVARRVEEVVPIDDGEPGHGAAKLSPIRMGGPLLIRIMSVFPGSNVPKGRAVLTSRLKPALEAGAGPLALNFFWDELTPGQHAETRGAVEGSEVLYYTPGLTDEALKVTVSLNYDKFDKRLVDTWREAIVKTAGLPVFATSFGPQTSALIYAADQAVKLVTTVVNRLVDSGDNTWAASDELVFALEGAAPREAGYLLFLSDDDQGKFRSASQNRLQTSFEDRGEHYEVDSQAQRLVYKGTKTEVLDGPAYVLVVASGAESPSLAAWKAAALSAELTEDFFSRPAAGPQDVSEAFAVYNDVSLMRDVLASRAKLSKPGVTAKDKAALKAKITGALAGVQDESFRKLLEE